MILCSAHGVARQTHVKRLEVGRLACKCMYFQHYQWKQPREQSLGKGEANQSKPVLEKGVVIKLCFNKASDNYWIGSLTKCWVGNICVVMELRNNIQQAWLEFAESAFRMSIQKNARWDASGPFAS